MIEIILYHVFIIVGFIVCFIGFVFVTRGRRPVSNILAWLFFVFLMPYIGIPLFLILGQRKLNWIVDKKRLLFPKPMHCPVGCSSMERLLHAFGVTAATQDNRLEWLTDGVVAYHTIVQKFQQAQESILISTYILANDDVGNALLDVLMERALAGVQVCILLDTIGCFRKAPRTKLRAFKKAGGLVRYIMPLLHVPFRGRVNLRDHRKIMIIDGTTAIVGGMNLSEDYMGPHPSPKMWTDLCLALQGSAVHDLLHIFESDWQFSISNREKRHYQRPRLSIEPVGNSAIQPVASGPDTIGDQLYDAMVTAVYEATTSIYIVTPYFILDDGLQKAFLIALRRGIDVNIVIPLRSNHPTTDLVRSITIRKLHAQGAKIWFYPKMIHAKAMIFDNTLAVIGSANFDIRSLLLNFEVSCFLYTATDIAQLRQWVETLLPLCTTRFHKPTVGRMWLEDAAQLIKPLL